MALQYLRKPAYFGNGGTRFVASERVLQKSQADVVGFCVIDPVREKDPFFVSQGTNHQIIKVLDIIGVAGYPLQPYIPDPANTEGHEADYLKTVMNSYGWGGLAVYWNSSLNLIGYISLESYPKWVDAEIKAREAKGLPSYSEKFYADFGDYVELLANVQKEKVKTWVLSEEIDLAHMKWPHLSQAKTDARYVRMVKTAYERLKKADPGWTRPPTGWA